MTISRQKRAAWETKLKARAVAAQKATEDVLVDVHKAMQDGVSQADIARWLGDKSASGVPAKALKGLAILERRRRGSKTP